MKTFLLICGLLISSLSVAQIQDSIQFPAVTIPIVPIIPLNDMIQNKEVIEEVIIDASYDGQLNDLYHSIYNAYSFNNLQKKDIINYSKGKSFVVFYVKFAVSEDGKPFEYSPHEISDDNPFYLEAVRVISATKWNVALRNDLYHKQYIVIPFKVNLADLP